ncbi:MAG: histidine phosphatase family protein [Pseudohongiella sp.]|nr:histidine phosphatase family protein [Pseudohongiella sp.]MDP2128102.1 histidine phosphatase family protein [Pseudohongiella sp.]
MSQLFLVRHGQASFGAANYDQLSDLGYQQARWLGEHFGGLDIKFDRVVAGSLARQQQTAQEIQSGIGQSLPIDIDPGFNEFDFHTLTRIYCHSCNIELPGTSDGGRLFFQMLRKAMVAWSQDELYAQTVPVQQPYPAALETWDEFYQRVHSAMQSLSAPDDEQNVLVVSSGGAMAMAVSQILGCGVDTLINLNLQTRNTGIHHFYFNQRGFQLAAFNNQPHLQRKDRLHALTYT